MTRIRFHVCADHVSKVYFEAIPNSCILQKYKRDNTTLDCVPRQRFCRNGYNRSIYIYAEVQKTIYHGVVLTLVFCLESNETWQECLNAVPPCVSLLAKPGCSPRNVITRTINFFELHMLALVEIRLMIGLAKLKLCQG